jgi:23S rRNA pseudouridine2605 synthase
MERLQKYMAICGVASRRKCEELIIDGRVKVNGTVITQLGTKVDPEGDKIEIDGKLIEPFNKNVYIMLNKPEGYVTTVKDQFDRPTVLSLVKGEVSERIYPVGRLDYDSCGLIILTNDGDLTYKITHPSHNVTKSYLCILDKIPSPKSISDFCRGVDIGDYKTAPAFTRLVEKRGNKGVVEVEISEGKNRQIRRMWDALGYKVIFLQRVSVGKIQLGSLKEGRWRFLTPEEIKYLKSKA